jgi:alcohol dehydrogenase, propanol-preferring
LAASIKGFILRSSFDSAEDGTPIFDVVMNRVTIRGSIVGGREDLAEAIAFAAEGKVRAEIHKTNLDNINQVFADLKAGTINGRAVLMM